MVHASQPMFPNVTFFGKSSRTSTFASLHHSYFRQFTEAKLHSQLKRIPKGIWNFSTLENCIQGSMRKTDIASDAIVVEVNRKNWGRYRPYSYAVGFAKEFDKKGFLVFKNYILLQNQKRKKVIQLKLKSTRRKTLIITR